MKRNLSTLLLLAVLLSMYSCGQSTAVETEINDTASETDAIVEETKKQHDLPEDLDFGGESVRFLYREEIIDEFYATELTGEVVNDETLQAFLDTEETLNIKVEVTQLPGHYVPVRNSYMNAIKDSVIAGDDVWDWCDAMFGYYPDMAVNGTFRDISQLEYMDFSKPYYLDGLMDVADLNGKLYFLGGDASLGYLKNIYCLVYNLNLAAKLGITEDIGQLALDGGWTADKLNTLVEMAYADLDGDGEVDTDDQLGYYERNILHRQAYMYGYGSQMIQKVDDTYQFTFGQELDVSVIETVHKLIFQTTGAMYSGINDQGENYQTTANGFLAGNILFMTSELREVEALRDMEDDFLVLPIPKFNEAQEQYIASSRNTHSAFGMPVTCGNPEMAGAAMECLSAERYEAVVPAYYDQTMKVKNARDPKATAILDMIRESTRMDLGYTYNSIIGNPVDALFNNMVATPDKFISNIESSKASRQSKLDNYIAALNELPEIE